MKRILISSLCLFAFAVSVLASDPAILPFSEVRKGMKGYGLTVFHGQEVERFDVEVLGVLHKTGPNRNLILARVDADIMRDSGVIAGMSGSPIYIEDRLVGALAYSWQFAKEPIAGITPIEEMLQLQTSRTTDRPVATSGVEGAELLRGLASGDVQVLESLFSRMIPLRHQTDSGAVPLTVPLAFSQFSMASVERFGSVFQSRGLLPVPAGSSSAGAGELGSLNLNPGDAFAAVLVEGDFSLAATGTVTRVDGEKIFGFGHPFLHMGEIEFPMAKSEVVAILPSLATSFKLSNTGPTVGTLVQDRHSGVFGYTGRQPRMIPVDFTLESAGAEQRFAMRVVPNGMLFPLIVAFAADSVVAMGERGAGERTIMLDASVHLVGREPIRVREAWAGTEARQSIPLYLALVSGYLLSNEFDEAEIERLEVRLEHADELRTARLLDAVVESQPDGQINPGDLVLVRARLKPFRGEVFEQTLQLRVPPGVSPGRAHLFIGNGTYANRLEFSLVPPDPRSLDQVVEVIERLRPSSELTMGLYSSSEGRVTSGYYLPSLPPTMQALMASGSQGGASVKYHEDARDTKPLDYVVTGTARIDLEIRPSM